MIVVDAENNLNLKSIFVQVWKDGSVCIKKVIKEKPFITLYICSNKLYIRTLPNDDGVIIKNLLVDILYG